MNISIIGVSDSFARNLADWAIKAGHNITFVGPSYQQAVEFVNELGVGKPVGPEAPLQDEVIFIAIPYFCLQPVLQTYEQQLGKKIVIDLITPVDLGTFQLIRPAEGSTSLEIKKHWNKSEVVKAFNAQLSGKFLMPNEPIENQNEVFLAGDEEAKRVASRLFREGGLTIVDAGTIHEANDLEIMGYLQMESPVLLNLKRKSVL